MDHLLLTTLPLLAGLCLCAAAYHVRVGMDRPSQHLHFLLSLVSLAATGYILAKVGSYRAESSQEVIERTRVEYSLGLITLGVLPWLVAAYTKVAARTAPAIITVLIGGALLANLILPHGIGYSHAPEFMHVTLPWGEQVADLTTRGGFWFTLGWLVIAAILGYIIYAGVGFAVREGARRARRFLFAVGIFVVLVLINLLVNRDLIPFIHTAEFGFVAFVVLMNRILTRELLSNADTLKTFEAQFRTLVEQAPFSIQVLAPDGRTLRVNAAWERLWGLHLAMLTGYNILDDHQLIAKGLMPLIRRAFAGEAAECPPVEYDAREALAARPPTARKRFVRSVVFPVKDDAGTVRAVILIHEDVAHRQRIEEAIRNIAAGVSAATGEKFFRDLVTHLAQLFGADYAFVGLLDDKQLSTVSTEVVYAHGTIAPNMKYSLDDTPCANVVGLQTCAYPRGVQQLFPQDKLLVEMGAEAYIGTPLFDDQNRPIGLLVVVHSEPLDHIDQAREILEIFASRTAAEIRRLRAERKLRASEQRLAALLDIAPGAIISIDDQQNILVFNREAQHVFGYSAQEIIGTSVHRLLPDRYRASHPEAITNFAKEPDDVRRTMGRPTIIGLRKNGEEFPAEAAISKLTLDGRTVYTAALQDITERQLRENELRRYRDDLESLVAARTAELAAANKELEAFSYSVSHDLRAPLRALQGFSTALAEDCGSQIKGECLDYLGRIKAASERMGRLIDDMLQLSRITRAPLQRVHLDLCSVVQQVIDALRQRDTHRNVDLALKSECMAWGDMRLLTIALENLVGNAWKFTRNHQQPRIEFGQILHNGEPVFYVRDNGAGFDMAYVDKLFQPFQRLHSEQDFEGTGVGLTIVERIIQRHGGHIWAEGEPGEGATFYFTLNGGPPLAA